MIDFKDRSIQVAIVVVLIVAITGLRMVETQTGPLYLIPVVLAALWFGRWPGLAVGLVASLLDPAHPRGQRGRRPSRPSSPSWSGSAVYGGLG